MKEAKTYWVKIFVGLREGYDGPVHSQINPILAVREYCDEEGLCATITQTTFLYTDGQEPGIEIGLINYPRFPQKPYEILKKAKEIARRLMVMLKQNRISIMDPFTTYMLEKEKGDDQI